MFAMLTYALLYDAERRVSLTYLSFLNQSDVQKSPHILISLNLPMASPLRILRPWTRRSSRPRIRRIRRSGSASSSSSSVTVFSSGGNEQACLSVKRSMACVFVNASETAWASGGREVGGGGVGE